jgi:tRNA threonylcarbamoyladenosine dehydratase
MKQDLMATWKTEKSSGLSRTFSFRIFWFSFFKAMSNASTSILAGIACAGFILVLYRLTRNKAKTIVHKSQKYPSNLLAEQFTRNIQFFGEEGQLLVEKAKVIVVGAGGVGSHACISLARSGVQNLRIIDFDLLTVSSLNRHASGTWKDVGLPKVLSLKETISTFAPLCKVDAVHEMFTASTFDKLIAEFNPDFVIDAIDNVPTKLDLIELCLKHNIPLISSCGSACKLDPSKVRVGALSEVTEDELGRAVRNKLKKRLAGFEPSIEQLTMIFSTEKSAVSLMPLKDHQQGAEEEFQVHKGFRVRTLPVVSPMPANYFTTCRITWIGRF